MHRTITTERILAAVEENTFGLSNTGFCRACGEEQGGCEPDARNYKCHSCGKREVFGAEELLMSVAF